MADNTIYTAEKTLKDAGDKIQPELKREVEDKIMALKNLKDKDDVEATKKALEELSQSLQKAGAAMYQQQQKENPNGKTGTEEPKNEEKKEEDKKDNK